jgi:O-antigen/teichoic acid export membrane protein
LIIAIAFFKGKINVAGRSASIMLALTKFGKYVLGTNLGSMILNKMDVFLIGAFIGPAGVAIYNAASKLINVIEIPLSSISQVCFPRIAKAYHTETPVVTGRIYVRGLALAIFVLLPLCTTLFLFAKPIILIIAGDQYLSGVWVLRILAVSVLFKPFGRFLGITLDAVGKPNWNFNILLLSICVNIALSLIFIKWIGTTGVALATLLTILSIGLPGQLILKQIVPLSPRDLYIDFISNFRKSSKTINISNYEPTIRT